MTNPQHPLIHRRYNYKISLRVLHHEVEEPLDGLFPYSKNKVQEDNITVIHTTKLAVLQLSVDRGCLGCSAIHQAILSAAADDGVSATHGSEDENSLQLYWKNMTRDNRLRTGLSYGILEIQLMVRKAGSDETLVNWTINLDIDCTSETQSELFDHPFVNNDSTSLNYGETGSTASLVDIKSWLSRCDSSHTICRRADVPLPKRVLELKILPDSSKSAHEPDISVRLVEDITLPTRYACLSHRWGSATHTCQTTKSSLSDHLISIPWAKLPKTFQDAVSVTVSLGISYIWIDSLCIVQDDADDWATQAAQMCDIYTRAYVTLAATCSSDSDEGLFRTSPSYPFAINSGLMGLMRRRRGYLVRRVPEHPTWQPDGLRQMMVTELPLLGRAWVYQERLLSARIVHFTRYELYFECAQPEAWTATCQCGHGPGGAWGGGSNGASGTGQFTDKRKYLHAEALGLLVRNDGGSRGKLIADIDVRRYWHQIVTEYSGLSISYDSDRLPALAGIARQFSSAHEGRLGRYVAGMWDLSLVYDMLWYSREGSMLPRRDTFVGPSWSWISATGLVETATACGRVHETDLEVKDCRVAIKGLDEFGAVNEVELRLDCFLVDGILQRHDVSNLAQFEAKGERARFTPDYSVHEPGEHHLSVESQIFCMRTGFIWGGESICLFLKAVDQGGNRFERIGCGLEVPASVMSAWFQDVKERREIVLV
ncbi:heterokaryon incompatibility protein-domain-containing protein [Bombardia bombarda]|uniref:Heterokaryon incompatibility protein-domain-containing protein n=1 Tax=Bombardia bombarda TaxID=252184 RepID=A0AA39TVM1_9PEZI|nr:heterokaryon incompatibility protein-domain-containing protein [Bombardia bombarda]